MNSRSKIPGLMFSLLCSALLLGACAPSQRQVVEADPPISQQLTVYAYPLQGQGLEQQERDRYECSLWASDQSGFDPSMSYLAPHQRVRVVPQPSTGQYTAGGAVAGAMIGAASGPPGDSFGRAVVGALIGAFIGATADAANREQVEFYYQQNLNRGPAALERRAEDYRRALKACLGGRGYDVR